MTDLLAAIEATAFVQWMIGSLWAYPSLLTMHAVGLSLTVGVSVTLDLRLLGLYSTIPVTSVAPLLRLAWVGIILNTVSGALIFTTQATAYPSNVPFVVKMVFVVLGALTLVATQRALRSHAAHWEAAGRVSADGRRLALASIVFWTVAVATGRLIAYA